MSDSDQDRLLSVLEAHGQAFLNSFSYPNTAKSSTKRKSEVESAPLKRRRLSEELEEEWNGVSDNAGSLEEESGYDFDEEYSSGAEDFEHTDDEFAGESNTKNVVVFSDVVPRRSNVNDPTSKAQMKAFMSSKISKLTELDSQGDKTKKTTREEKEDQTNAQNDALLHKLVHTKLLSGSLTTELDMTPAQRRKALAGRVLELTGSAKLGKGERQVRDSERNKAAKRVREGISQKQKERGKQELEEAKNLGNYHPTLKKVFEATSSTPPVRKREKGLSMGVGKFSNGFLRLSKDDVSMAIGESSRGFSGRGRGRGRGGRGRPGKRR